MQTKDHVIIAIGRFQPPTAGHHEMVNHIKELANAHNADHLIFTFPTHGDVKNPLHPDLKVKHMRTVLDTNNVFMHPEIKNPGDVFQLLHNKGYKKITLVAGGKRVEDFEKFRKYFGKTTESQKTGKVLDLSNINPSHFNVHPIERDADSDTGGTEIESHMIEPRSNKMRLPFVSGSRMRAAVGGDIHTFMSMLPSHVSFDQGKELQSDLRKSIKNLREEVSAQTRIKLSRIAKRTAKIRAVKRKSRQRRRRNIKQLKRRAKQEVKSNLRHRYFKGSWQKLGFGTRANIDKNVNKRKKIADSMIKRILPNVIKGESERLNRINTRRESVEEIILPLLLEARKGSRKVGSTKSGANSIKSRKQATARKQKQRSKEKLESDAGNVAGKYAVVRAKSGKYKGRVMVVDDQTYDPSKHDVITKPEDFDLGDGQKVLQKKEFINTASSKKLYGLIAGEGMAKLPKVKRNSKANKNAKNSPAKEQLFKKPKKEEENQLPELDLTYDETWRMPKNQKDRGFKAEDYEWAFTTVAEIAVNGEDPKKLLENGDISEDQYNQLAGNKNLTQAVLRALQKSGFAGAEKGRYKFIHSGRGLGQGNSDLYKSMGATDATPKADVFVYDTKDPKKSLGISFKSGAAQLGSSKEKETKAMATYAYEQTKNSLDKNCKGMIENLIKDGFDQMGNNLKLPGGINVFKRDVGGVATRNPKVKKAVQDSIKANKELESTVGKIFDKCKPFKKALLREAATGQGKNQGQYSKYMMDKYGKKVDAGTATHILAISDDASNASLIEMDDKFFDELEPNVKMYIAAKTTDADITSEIKEYKDTKKQLVDVAKSDNFKDFKKIVEKRVYAGYERKGLKAPSLTDKELKDSMKSIAETGNLPNVFKFKLMQAKSALRLGVAGHENEEIKESVIYKFSKNYLSEEAVVAISSELDKNNGNNNSVYDELMELEESDDLEYVNPDQWLEMCKEYVGDDLMKYLEFMGVELNGFDTNEINFADLFGQKYSSRMNTVYINGRPKYIPVIESFLNEKRNYRKEYDNYHSNPEQRKNRSKRVLARRLMMKLGKVKKGDGKDVDHKDGNPKNNGKSNLRVRSKSANRADNG